MLQIKVLAFGCLCPCEMHSAAVVTDLDTAESFIVDYSGYGNTSEANVYDHPTGCDGRSVDLYTEGNLRDFIVAFNHAGFTREKFQSCRHNCSDAILFTLNYFFPNTTKINSTCNILKILCNPGILRCLPSPCCTIPDEPVNRAYLLSFQYGKHPALEQKHRDNKDEQVRLQLSKDDKQENIRFFASSQLSRPDIALCLAVASHDLPLAKKLLKEGVNPNVTMIAPDEKTLPPFVTAMQRKQNDMIELLLEHKFDVNTSLDREVKLEKQTFNQGTSPLSFATVCNAVIFQRLLDAKADVKACDSRGYTALHWAAAKHKVDAVRVLLKHGIAPDVKSRSGQTPLDIAKATSRVPLSANLYGLLAPAVLAQAPSVAVRYRF